MIHWFDILAAVFLAASAVWSLYRGFMQEVFSILSLVAGYAAAAAFYKPLGEHFSAVGGSPLVSQAGAFFLIFFATVIAVVVAGGYIRRAARLSGAVSAADRIAGAALGVVKGALILAVVVYPLSFTALGKDVATMSRSGPVIVAGSEWALAKLAPGLAGQVAQAGEKADRAAREAKETVEKTRETLEKLEKAAPAPRVEPDAPAVAVKPSAPAPRKKAPPTKEKGTSPDQITEKDRAELDDLLKQLK